MKSVNRRLRSTAEVEVLKYQSYARAKLDRRRNQAYISCHDSAQTEGFIIDSTGFRIPP